MKKYINANSWFDGLDDFSEFGSPTYAGKLRQLYVSLRDVVEEYSDIVADFPDDAQYIEEWGNSLVQLEADLKAVCDHYE